MEKLKRIDVHDEHGRVVGWFTYRVIRGATVAPPEAK